MQPTFNRILRWELYVLYLALCPRDDNVRLPNAVGSG